MRGVAHGDSTAPYSGGLSSDAAQSPAALSSPAAEGGGGHNNLEQTIIYVRGVSHKANQ